MKVSVVIATYSADRLADLLAAAESVRHQSYQDREVMVVVDNNPGLYQRLQHVLPSPVRLVLSDQGQGLSAARNRGIELSRGEVVAFLDDDAVAQPDWLERLLANYRDPRVMAVGGRAVPLWQGGPARWLPEELHWVIGCTYSGYADGKTAEVRNIHGNTMSFRRDVFERIGPFSPVVGHSRNLLGGDETEFCIRLTSRIPGAKIIYDPSVVIYHRVPAERCTVGHLLRRSYGEGVSKALISSMVSHNGIALSDERRHLSSLTRALGKRLKVAAKGNFRQGLGQGMAIVLAVAATGLGYSLTRLRSTGRQQRRLPRA